MGPRGRIKDDVMLCRVNQVVAPGPRLLYMTALVFLPFKEVHISNRSFTFWLTLSQAPFSLLSAILSCYSI